MEPDIRFQLLEGRFHRILAQLRELRRRHPDARPMMVVELWGTPKAGKSTMLTMIRDFLKRNGWKVTARPEGAEVVDFPRTTPHYNLQTCRYAMTELFTHLYGDWEAIILDRGLKDGEVWMDYWLAKGKITELDHRAIVGGYNADILRDLFDLHLCMVCEPETAIQRELAHAISKKEGETMNSKTLRALREIHERVYARATATSDPRLAWHDTSKETPIETSEAVLSTLADAFDRRLRKHQ